MTKIITISGQEALKSECRSIKGKFYKIGNIKEKDSGDCFIFNKNGKNTYFTLNNGKITWDYENEEYVLIKESDLQKGFVEPNVIGYFAPNVTKNVWVSRIDPYDRNFSTSNLERCISAEVALQFCKLSPGDGIYYYNCSNSRLFHGDHSWLSKNDIRTYPAFQSGIYNYAESDMGSLVQKTHESIEIPINDTINHLNAILPYTFGIEMEVSKGRVPENILFKHGFVPLKDGSLPAGGIEYASIPFEAGKGIANLSQALLSFQNTCKVDDKCSLHVHVGNILERMEDDSQKLFLIALYMLYYHIQKEVWSILPNYKKTFRFLANKEGNKDHCQDLHSLGLFDNRIFETNELNKSELDKNFSTLFRFVNDNVPQTSGSNWKNRKYQNAGTPKWNIRSRYFALNLFNAFFSNSKTVEFRAHSGTVNKDKTIYWILICLAIVKFAEDNIERIIKHKDKFNLTDILEVYYENKPLYTELCQYIDNRKQYFIDCYLNGDDYGSEFSKDHLFTVSRIF